MIRKPGLSLLILLLCLSMAAVAVGQTTTSSLRGRVMDESGNAFPTAEITAIAVSSGYRYTGVAGEDGSFLLSGLAPGSYRVEVVAPAYRGATREVTLLVGQTVETNFSLRPDTVLTEEMTVVGNVPVEMETSEVATNITPHQIENLPQNDRNFLNFAALAPGVLLGTDELKKEIRAGAQGSSAINVFIDGVSFKNDVIQGGVVGQDSSRGNPFPQNAVQEFRVITQNFSAEYQKASSAIITAVTKSGSNELSGDAFYLYQDKSLVAENPFTHAKPEYERGQYGVSIGGPIIPDRMHYFVSYGERPGPRRDGRSRHGVGERSVGAPAARGPHRHVRLSLPFRPRIRKTELPAQLQQLHRLERQLPQGNGHPQFRRHHVARLRGEREERRLGQQPPSHVHGRHVAQ